MAASASSVPFMSAPQTIHMSRAVDPVWGRTADLIESFEVDSDGVYAFLGPVLKKRCSLKQCVQMLGIEPEKIHFDMDEEDFV